MPASIVPRLDSENIAIPGARVRVNADADAFGALEARAMGRVSQGLANVAATAEKVDDEFNEANAAELDAQYSARLRNRLYNPESGYLTTARGANALSRRQEIETGLQADMDELIGSARSPRAAALARDVMSRRAQSTLNSVATHVAQEARTYQTQQSESRIAEGINSAAALLASGNFDEGLLRASMGPVAAEIDALATREGWSPERKTERMRDAQSGAYAIAIRQAAAIDPARARTLYDRVSPGLSADDRLDLETVMARAEREFEDEATDAAWAALSEGRPIPANVWARVPGRNRIAIQNERRARADRAADAGAVPRDRPLISDLNVEAIANPEAFSRRDLRALRDRLGETAYQSLAEEQARIRRGETRTGISREMAQGAMAMASRQLRAAGYDLSSDASEPDAEKVADFQLDVIGLFDRFVRDNDGQLPNASQQMEMIQNLLTTRVVNPPGLFNKREFRATDVYTPYAQLTQAQRQEAANWLRQRNRPVTAANIERYHELRAQRQMGAGR